jgi:RHS repeat-associated protein
MAATYRYDPFGSTISSSGSIAATNVYRFSSKEVHPNTGMYTYLYRFYDPSLQRWLNRDPILEAGGVNLYSYVANRVPNRMDPFGLEDGDGNCPGTPKGKGDNCYQYACGTSGRGSDTPGARGNQPCPVGKQGDCNNVLAAAAADPGISQVPPGGDCPSGSHKIGVAAGHSATGGPDFHFFRQGNDGSWCYKFRGKDPTNIGSDGKPITDPKPGDIFNFSGDAGHQPSSFTFCGFLCAADSGK